ncbi:hypothetical protein D3C81_665510 [compost metagenome]
MLRQQRAADLVAGGFQLCVEVNPGLVGHCVIAGDDFQGVCRFHIVVIGVAELFIHGRHALRNRRLLRPVSDPAVPSIGFLDRGMELIEVFEKVLANLLELGQELQIRSDIGARRRVRAGYQLIDTVELLHQPFLDQADPLHRAVCDEPGAAALKVFYLCAFAAMAVQHQLIEIQVLGLGDVDIARAGSIGTGAKGRALPQFKAKVVLQRLVAAAGQGIELSGVGVSGVGQGQLPAQGTVRPPARQPAANGGRPERVEPVGHVPKHRATSDAAAFDHGAVHRVVCVPVA